MRSILKLNFSPIRCFLSVALFLSWPLAVCAKLEVNQAVGASKKVDAVEVQLVSNYLGLPPKGETLQLGLRIKHDPHWHTYWRNPGDSGLPTQFDVKLPTGWLARPIVWPAPQAIAIGPLLNFGFEGEIILPVKIDLPSSAVSNGALRTDTLIQAKAQWLMCKDVCIPGEADLTLLLKAGADGNSKSAFSPLFDEMRLKSPTEVLLAEYLVAKDTGRVKLGISLPATVASSFKSVYFFPYETGLIKAPDVQQVFQLNDGLRLEASLAADAPIPEVVLGLVSIDGKPFEVKASKALEPSPAWLLGGVALPSASQTSIATKQSTLQPRSQSLWLTLGLAVLGGFILNLMPCVFPVLGLKVLGFASHGTAAQAGRVKAAGLFAAGVLVSFWILAAVMAALQSAGEAVGWGFQLQSPWFVIAMAWLFTLIGLNLSGLFEVGLSFTRLGNSGSNKPSLWTEFGSGVLAVLVATPCTAPFMGAALGATLSQTVAEKFAVFTALGVGMALPYVLLTLSPNLKSYLPRPGRWMETFKQFLAFPMYATVAWLVWVLGQQTDLNAMLMLSLSLIMLSMAAWFYGRWQSGAGKRVGQLVFAAVAALFGVGLIFGVGSESKVDQMRVQWEPWSEVRVQTSLAAGKPVLVDFTAAWCVSCQVNKAAVLDRASMQQFFTDKKIVLLRADWTKRDAAITAELARYGRNGVPLYQAWLPGVSQPVLLPELLTSSAVTDAFGSTQKP
jgi:thiol:disulfide interchange protein/DsbC/DsbD-like thiol-disulfide interchange protein